MDWFWENIVGVITTVLAVYGAFLSSLNFWHMWKRDKKELYIKAIFREVTDGGTSYVEFHIVNKSLRPITIKEFGFKYASSPVSKLLKHPDYNSNTLEPLRKLNTSEECYAVILLWNYANHAYRVDLNRINNSMVKAVPYVIDTEEQRYRGKPFKHPAKFYLNPKY